MRPQAKGKEVAGEVALRGGSHVLGPGVGAWPHTCALCVAPGPCWQCLPGPSITGPGPPLMFPITFLLYKETLSGMNSEAKA